MDPNLIGAIIGGLLGLLGIIAAGIFAVNRHNGKREAKAIGDPRQIPTGDLTVEYLEERLRDLFMPPILNGLKRGEMTTEYQEATLRMLAKLTHENKAVETLIASCRRKYEQ